MRRFLMFLVGGFALLTVFRAECRITAFQFFRFPFKYQRVILISIGGDCNEI